MMPIKVKMISLKKLINTLIKERLLLKALIH